MALDLTEDFLGTTEHRLTFAELAAIADGMSESEYNDFMSSVTVKSFGDEVFNSNGELVVGPIVPKDSIKFSETGSDTLSLGKSSSTTSTAYPLDIQDSSWADQPAVESTDQWDIQTASGPATSYVDPSERTILYHDENGDPVYSNIDGDYLYDDYNGDPVYYDTDTAIANGADAIVYTNDGASLRDGVNPGIIGVGASGSKNGKNSGGTGAQVGSSDGVGTRLTSVKKEDTIDPALISDFARVVNKNLVEKMEGKWEDNPLDKYTTYSYRVTLFCININKYQEFQDSKDRIKYIKSLSRSDKFIFYETGINTDVELENLEIKSYYGSNSTYKNVIFTELNMTLHEPSGASLLEKLKEIASLGGYISMASMPYFMEITYVGYVGDGSDKDGVQEILEGYSTFIPFYIAKFIPTINLDTKYTVQGFPISVLAVLKDSFTLKTDISIDIPAGSNLGMMIEAIGKEVNRQYVEGCTETTKQLYAAANKAANSKVYQYAGENISTAIYIDVDEDISSLALDNDKVMSQFPELSNNGTSLTFKFANGTPLNQIFDEIRKVVSFTAINGTIFEHGDDVTPKDWLELCKTFTFVPETRFVGQDPEMGRSVNSFVYKLFKKFNPAYIPPFESLLDKDKAKLNKAEYRALLCKAILDHRGLRKRYLSYNTGMNDQVLNVKLDLDNLFYVRIPTKGVQDPTAGVKTSISYDNPYEPDQKGNITIEQNVKDKNEENANLSGMPVQRDTVREYGTSATGSSASGSDRALNSIYTEIYRSGGMIQLAITVKGDPYWISNYAVSRNSLQDTEDAATCNFRDGLLHLYFEVVLPRVTQDYHNNPDGGELIYSGQVNKVISGVYMVISVTSQFNAGKFTQVIDCVMNNNLPMTYNGVVINQNDAFAANNTNNTDAQDEANASSQLDKDIANANNSLNLDANFANNTTELYLNPQKPTSNLWSD